MKTHKRAAAVVRISEDKTQELGLAGRQAADFNKLADTLGWMITDIVTENDTSAFNRCKDPAPTGASYGLAVTVDGQQKGTWSLRAQQMLVVPLCPHPK